MKIELIDVQLMFPQPAAAILPSKRAHEAPANLVGQAATGRRPPLSRSQPPKSAPHGPLASEGGRQRWHLARGTRHAGSLQSYLRGDVPAQVATLTEAAATPSIRFYLW